MVVPVILAGGSGTRLWPLSRQQYPKQFLPLLGDNTMLQETVARLSGLDHAHPLIICGEDHRFTVAEQLRTKNAAHGGIILEPASRNTAPAIALAALSTLKNSNDSDPLLLVLAADHSIQNIAAFQQAVNTAITFANQDQLVTFGIVPKAPETGYGYIKKGAILSGGKAMSVAEFVEKPDMATAEQYLSTDKYLWNSGMFLFKASCYIEELKNYRPDIYAACEASIQNGSIDADFIRPCQQSFETCPEDSIDYAVMEKSQSTVVVPMDCNWSDIGSWSALWDISEKDQNGNLLKGDILTVDSENCFIQGDKKLVATIGLNNIIIVDSDDAIMVADKNRVQDVKQIVSQLKKEQRPEALQHRKVYRPWGYYDSIDSGDRFQVKRIVVKPGARLSLQMHHHRAEHWVVVSGTAHVTRGGKEFLLPENESVFIAIGETHRLENRGSIPLEIIEVQSGSYLGEDDIVRFEDNYGRS